MRHQVTQLGQDELVHCESHRWCRAWHHQYERIVDHAAAGTTEHRGWADLFVAEHAKQLAVAGELFGEQLGQRFRCLIAGRNAGTTR